MTTGFGGASVWRAVWRQHRSGVVLTLLISGILTVAALIVRFRLLANSAAWPCVWQVAETEACSSPTPELESQIGETISWTMHWNGSVLPAVALFAIGLGVLLGAPLFAKEFEEGTHSLALSQSVPAGRWWAAKITVVALPLIVGLLAVGAATRYTSLLILLGGSSPSAQLGRLYFFGTGLAPVALGLATFGVGVLLGTLIRRSVAAITVALIAVLIMAVPVNYGYVHLAPAEREVIAVSDVKYLSDFYQWGIGDHPEARTVRDGYLDAAGTPIRVDTERCFATTEVLPEEPESVRVEAYGECLGAQGAVAKYEDRLLPAQYWPLQVATAGVLLGVAALALLIGRRILPFALRHR